VALEGAKTKEREREQRSKRTHTPARNLPLSHSTTSPSPPFSRNRHLLVRRDKTREMSLIHTIGLPSWESNADLPPRVRHLSTSCHIRRCLHVLFLCAVISLPHRAIPSRAVLHDAFPFACASPFPQSRHRGSAAPSPRHVRGMPAALRRGGERDIRDICAVSA
jgi:hypothetical protein